MLGTHSSILLNSFFLGCTLVFLLYLKKKYRHGNTVVCTLVSRIPRSNFGYLRQGIFFCSRNLDIGSHAGSLQHFISAVMSIHRSVSGRRVYREGSISGKNSPRRRWKSSKGILFKVEELIQQFLSGGRFQRVVFISGNISPRSFYKVDELTGKNL